MLLAICLAQAQMPTLCRVEGLPFTPDVIAQLFLEL